MCCPYVLKKYILSRKQASVAFLILLLEVEISKRNAAKRKANVTNTRVTHENIEKPKIQKM